MIVMKIYRIAHWLYQKKVPLLPWLLKSLNRIAFSVVLPPSAQLGRNVLLSYEGLGTVIHRRAIIGDDAIVSSNVTIGGKVGDGVPVVMEGAFIGTGAKILGDVRIGRFASIGANAVVLSDVPDYGVAVGIPAKVVRINSPEDMPEYRRFQQKN